MKGFSRRSVRLFLMVMVFFLIPFSLQSQSNTQDSLKSVISYIDNTKGVVVIGDSEYKLKLNTKVTDIKKRKLNRYALKVGQKVKFASSFRGRIHYLDSVVIVTD